MNNSKSQDSWDMAHNGSGIKYVFHIDLLKICFMLK